MASGLRRGWRYGVAVCWLLACGGVVGKPTVGGESHFLRYCGDGCGRGLECFSDICTRGCVVGQDTCSELSQAALCTNASVEPGVLAICDVTCASNQDCRALGSRFECSGGFCRDAGPVPEPAGGGGSGAGGSGAGGSGAGGSGAGGSGAGGSGAGGSGAGGETGQPWTPPSQCSLPFKSGECMGYEPVFAAVNGTCVPKIYGGCNGNDNRFLTLEECLSACEGRPTVQSCPADRPAQKICLECGPADGCTKLGTFCAQACDETHPCDSQGLTCLAGTCMAACG